MYSSTATEDTTKDTEYMPSLKKGGDQSRTLSLARKLGVEVLNDTFLNKGTAFPPCERERLHIRGLLPPATTSIEIQGKRVWKALQQETDKVKQWFYLANLQVGIYRA